MRRKRLSTLIALAVFAAVAWPAAGQERPGGPPSLYERMGRYDRIAKFVDTAFPRVASHQQLRRLFQGHARDSQVRQRQLIIDALCQATGGPCAYTGRPMKPVHTGLGITAADWTVFVGVLGGALDELKFGALEKKEFLAMLDEHFRPDVVGH
jgi:hemoglobin